MPETLADPVRSAAAARRLIVNADDFGQTNSINQGIAHSVEHGIVTSASLMVRFPAAIEAAAIAARLTRLSVGLHVDLGEWTCRAGEWSLRYSVVPESDADAVAAEITRQLSVFRQLIGRDPTHLDSHQHVHRSEPTRSILVALGRSLGIPVRHFGIVQHCGGFYGQTNNGHPYPEGLTVNHLIALIALLPVGVTEISCHPGHRPDVESMYCVERVLELDTLCDPRVRECLVTSGIELCSFHDLSHVADS